MARPNNADDSWRRGGDNVVILPLAPLVTVRTRFVLIQTSHAGNVGAAARAMKTMGFDDLVLVAPRWANVLRREETIQRASGALDVLANARIVDTLDEALDGMDHLCATAMTPRDFGPPTRTPREHFSRFAGPAQPASAPSAVETPPQGIAFLFGSERFGMRNEDVYRCHVCLSIAANPQFGSLNIGAALQVIAYEWRLALGSFLLPGSTPHNAPADAAQVAGMLAHLQESLEALGFLFGSERFGMRNEDVYRCHTCLSIPSNPKFGSLNLGAALQVVAYEWRLALGGYAVQEATALPVLADASQVAGMLAHLERSLIAIGFLDPQVPKKLMPRLNQLFNRAHVTQEEVQMLRGIAKAMAQQAGLPKPLPDEQRPVSD